MEMPLTVEDRIDHADAWNVAHTRYDNSNLARAYVEMRVTLNRLEEACERLAADRSKEAYFAIISTRDGSDALLALDFARNAAREILQSVKD